MTTTVNTRPLCAGDRVLIESASRGGTVLGKIEDIRSPEEIDQMPTLAPLEQLDAARTLREWDIVRLAVLSYYIAPGRALMFLALESSDGKWWDIAHQPVGISHYALC
jgi:hypothetical protein